VVLIFPYQNFNLTWQGNSLLGRVMETAKEVHNFSSACEHLLATVVIHRPLTEDEKRVVEYYCHEILQKITPPPTP
jgi:hypothetical protein